MEERMRVGAEKRGGEKEGRRGGEEEARGGQD